MYRTLAFTLSLALSAPLAAQPMSAPALPIPCDPLYDATLDASCDSSLPVRAGQRDERRPDPHRMPTPRPSAQREAEANRALIQKVYADFARGDVPAVLAILDPHVTWTEADGSPYAGTYVGPGTVGQEVFARLGAEWDAFEAVPSALVADGSRVVVLGEYRATYAATGRRVVTPFAHSWQVMDGLVVSFRQFTDAPPWQRVVAP